LVAFEYGPADADEMDWVAEPILQHLLVQGAQLLVVSTQPEGSATAESVLGRIAQQETREGQVANLGYQPGQTAAIQDLLQNLDDRTEVRTGLPATSVAAMDGVESAGDITAVVVLAAQPGGLRSWIEQLSVSYPDLPLLAGISARVEPVANPYFNSRAGQIEGMVSGVVGAATYAKLLGSEHQIALNNFYLPSLGIAHLVVIALMLVGMIVFIIAPGEKRR
jgi:hypothetical protein